MVDNDKAHIPTDDEREAPHLAHLDARQAAYQKEREDWYVDHEAEPGIASNAFFRGWDAAVDAGFRRSEVPEPSAEHQEHADARRAETMTLLSHSASQGEPRPCHLPKNAPPCIGCKCGAREPSDAQVEVAAKTLANRMGDGPWEDLLDTFQDDYRRDARAALRAAEEAR